MSDNNFKRVCGSIVMDNMDTMIEELTIIMEDMEYYESYGFDELPDDHMMEMQELSGDIRKQVEMFSNLLLPRR